MVKSVFTGASSVISTLFTLRTACDAVFLTLAYHSLREPVFMDDFLTVTVKVLPDEEAVAVKPSRPEILTDDLSVYFIP